MSGPTTDILTGLAALFNTNSVGVYQPTGAYADSDWAIILDLLPASPDNAIALRGYILTADPYPTASGIVGVQFQTRATTRAADRDKQDEIYTLLHARENTVFGSVHVALMSWKSAVPLGQDDTLRWESTSNYNLMVDYPPTSNRPD